ncbi:MAG: hypothetical protein HQL38_01125 [Alphaproteobacteria bacterium]|nr:hypothetical protein [Alphaproteobacteria bacterium]MBF0391256.1 hypothetical protein [Alphaproteobacteria bacterium]
MRRIVFVDLDDTLFQTHRKNPDANRLAAVDGDGNPLSFRCGRQEAFFEWLIKDATVVPVTGRSVEAFRRVTIPLSGHAICSFGGIILRPGGETDREWHRVITGASMATADLMEGLNTVVGSIAAGHAVHARHRIIREAGLPLYVSVKHNAGVAEEMCRLATAVSPSVPDDWTIHLNGSNMALLPPFLGKAAAVAHLLKHFVADGSVLTLGVGDSLTDVAFMGLCDFAVAPSKSQIMSVLSSQTPLGAVAGGGKR